METLVKRKSNETINTKDELFVELDKGIRDMEQGDVIPCDESIRKIRIKYGLLDV